MADYEDLQDPPDDDDETTTEYHYEQELNDTFQNARRTPLADQFATEKADYCPRDNRSQRCKTYIDQIINITEDYNLTDKRASSASSRKGVTNRYDVRDHTPIRARMQSAMKPANPTNPRHPRTNSSQNLIASEQRSPSIEKTQTLIIPLSSASRISIQNRDIQKTDPKNPSPTVVPAPLPTSTPTRNTKKGSIDKVILQQRLASDQTLNAGYDFDASEMGKKYFV